MPSFIPRADDADAFRTAPSFMNEFEPSQGGSMGYWVARWVNTHGETGPWSDVVSGTVPG